jgi:hypothetical protein
MEYRVFQSIDQETFLDRWNESTPGYEHRYDLYFMLSSIDCNEYDLSARYGLKLRYERYLELKVRTERYPNGQEHWIKQIRSNKNLKSESVESVMKVLCKANAYDIVQRLQSLSTLILCRVEKRQRKKQSITNGLLEHTGLCIQFIRASDRQPVTQPVFFETFCLEQSSLTSIESNPLASVLSDSASHSLYPMGYPEFLARQYASQMAQER